MTYEQFLEDEKTKDAVVRNLEVIGESAYKIPEEIREEFSHIPWTQIISLRNRLIHGYFSIDYRIVWEIIKTDIPKLKKNIELILQNLSIKI
uniref:DUF86 domain-containing protein n=1 Tax=Thermodesulfobacterium geofontis TaxID=1295609 RepID=A0A7V5XGL9_9BACT